MISLPSVVLALCLIQLHTCEREISAVARSSMRLNTGTQPTPDNLVSYKFPFLDICPYLLARIPYIEARLQRCSSAHVLIWCHAAQQSSLGQKSWGLVFAWIFDWVWACVGQILISQAEPIQGAQPINISYN